MDGTVATAEKGQRCGYQPSGSQRGIGVVRPLGGAANVKPNLAAIEALIQAGADPENCDNFGGRLKPRTILAGHCQAALTTDQLCPIRNGPLSLTTYGVTAERWHNKIASTVISWGRWGRHGSCRYGGPQCGLTIRPGHRHFGFLDLRFNAGTAPGPLGKCGTRASLDLCDMNIGRRLAAGFPGHEVARADDRLLRAARSLDRYCPALPPPQNAR